MYTFALSNNKTTTQRTPATCVAQTRAFLIVQMVSGDYILIGIVSYFSHRQYTSYGFFWNTRTILCFWIVAQIWFLFFFVKSNFVHIAQADAFQRTHRGS